LVSIQNTIIANNSAYNYDNCTGRGAVASLGHNLVRSSNECGYNSDLGDIFATNSMLGPLSDNGGPTLTHALLIGSPAIDAGDEADFPLTDQRGFSRPVDGNSDGISICDIGAYELQRCMGDFEPDGDVDGYDIFTQTIGGTGVFLAGLAEHFGRDNCPY
jgi:hypothetical protein